MTSTLSCPSKIILPLVFILVLTLIANLTSAHSEHQEHSSLEKAEAIINVNIPCDKLSQEELEYIGDYYMEKMHSGEAHELMDKMMGGEGSESLKQMHVSMAKILYCNETIGGTMGSQMISQNTTGLIGSQESIGMMGMMPMVISMMSSGMMNIIYGNMMSNGMMNITYSNMVSSNIMNNGMMNLMSGNIMSNGMMNGGMMNMMGFGYGSGMMSSTGWFGFLLLWLIYFAIASFVFGIVFWLAYKLIVKPQNNKK